ncbi:hypothetical protein ACWOC1_02170 [Enterococcus quebecensis]|uniref:Uncharacterized protein n=1 Tax=Enterococcus quebecensis TaxID=903983 RepID=A0A1E5H3B6_9ENTE|nr:hypothetical protein [Enterococcus quebecensis]OEG19374.1 hypothetical protein BCR23_01420 [Enterococcus quebecensis]OJG75703.1 hypothetical protein RV12_GL000042 [Enterococcus quebecensis]
MTVWYTDDKDGFITKGRKILFFKNYLDFKNYCIENRIICEENEVSFDIDWLIHWYVSNSEEINEKEMLDIWNIFTDLAYSIDEHFLEDQDSYNQVYSKLFYGDNLPTINKSGKIYTPDWSEEEIEEVRAVMKNGVELFERSIQIVN